MNLCESKKDEKRIQRCNESNELKYIYTAIKIYFIMIQIKSTYTHTFFQFLGTDKKNKIMTIISVFLEMDDDNIYIYLILKWKMRIS